MKAKREPSTLFHVTYEPAADVVEIEEPRQLARIMHIRNFAYQYGREAAHFLTCFPNRRVLYDAATQQVRAIA